jgi:hypothetical protein
MTGNIVRALEHTLDVLSVHEHFEIWYSNNVQLELAQTPEQAEQFDFGLQIAHFTGIPHK